MRASHTSIIAAVAVVSSLLACPQLEAQAAAERLERGCRGDVMSFNVEGLFLTVTDYPVITLVPPGTPAALAGLQPGDSVVTVAGRDSRERAPGAKRSFAPGDTLTLTVRRQQADLPIIIVFGRMVDDGTGVPKARVCRPVPATPKS